MHRVVRTLAIAASVWIVASATAEARFLQTDPVGYKDSLNLYEYVRNDPLNRSDPTGRQSVLLGVEIKTGARPSISGEPSRTGARDAGGALELGIAVGRESDGGYNATGYRTETVGGIWGSSMDAQLTISTANVDELDGLDTGVFNVERQVGALDAGAGFQVRTGGEGLDFEVQLSGGVGLAQEVGSISRTETVDVVTPALDAVGDALGAVRSAAAAVERRIESIREDR